MLEGMPQRNLWKNTEVCSVFFFIRISRQAGVFLHQRGEFLIRWRAIL